MGLIKKKLLDLTPESQITSAQAKSTEALILIEQAQEALKEANAKLQAAIEESDRRIDSLKAQLSHEEKIKTRALDEVLANGNLMKKLRDTEGGTFSEEDRK